MRGHRRIALVMLCCCAAGSAGLLFAQSFEVASIKPNKSGSQSQSWNTNDGGLRAENISLKLMIELAYEVRDYALVGPAWLDNERFDIVAKSPGQMKDEVFAAMLRSLLGERFGLIVHREPKSVSGYALLVGKKPPESHEMPEKGGSSVNWGSGRLEATNASMQQIADFLARQLGQPVQDLTSLRGAFDLKLRWTPDDRSAEATADAPSIFTAVQEQLGLKLQAQRVTVDVVVVDRIERTPTEN